MPESARTHPAIAVALSPASMRRGASRARESPRGPWVTRHFVRGLCLDGQLASPFGAPAHGARLTSPVIVYHDQHDGYKTHEPLHTGEERGSRRRCVLGARARADCERCDRAPARARSTKALGRPRTRDSRYVTSSTHVGPPHAAPHALHRLCLTSARARSQPQRTRARAVLPHARTQGAHLTASDRSSRRSEGARALHTGEESARGGGACSSNHNLWLNRSPPSLQTRRSLAHPLQQSAPLSYTSST